MDAINQQQTQQPAKANRKKASTQRAQRRRVAIELYAQVKRNGYRCALSGVELTPCEASIDHVTPLSGGGQHDIENLQIVHKTINRMKGCMSQEEFIKWCRLVSQWAS